MDLSSGLLHHPWAADKSHLHGSFHRLRRHNNTPRYMLLPSSLALLPTVQDPNSPSRMETIRSLGIHRRRVQTAKAGHQARSFSTGTQEMRKTGSSIGRDNMHHATGHASLLPTTWSVFKMQ